MTNTWSPTDPEIDLTPSHRSADRGHRRGPRPLALHIAKAEWAWRTADARRLDDFYRGIRAYRRHPYRRKPRRRTIVWQSGGCRLLDYGPKGGWPLLVVPSLINRAYILDLMPEASLLDFLHDQGIRPFLLDWGDGTGAEKRLSLDTLILERMKPALDRLYQLVDKRPMVLGYCMGGTLATALACLFQELIAGLVLLATPWSFHGQGHHGDGASLASHRMLVSGTGSIGGTPVDLLQALFAQIDPMNVPHKFARFARVPPRSTTAMRFVAIEDWLNDGIPLGAEAAASCFLDWYGSNAPALGVWKVDGHFIQPERLGLPVYLAIPGHDRIVPPKSALALANIIPNSIQVEPKSGHVGMIVGRNAKTALWMPLVQWLSRVAAMQKNPW